MTRWFIREVRIYSHDDRSRGVLFTPGVNVISGDSNTGKSALLAIVDYTLGASKSSLPDYVRRRAGWVAVLWERGSERLAVYRATPRGVQRQSEDFAVETSGRMELAETSAQIFATTNRDGALERISACFGIARRQHASVGALSPRHVLPFLFQTKSVINDDHDIVWGLDARHRPSTLAWLPYFLGVDSEEAVETRNQIRVLRRKPLTGSLGESCPAVA